MEIMILIALLTIGVLFYFDSKSTNELIKKLETLEDIKEDIIEEKSEELSEEDKKQKEKIKKAFKNLMEYDYDTALKRDIEE